MVDGSPPIDIIRGSHLGRPTIFFTTSVYLVNLAEDCKFTIIGKFYKGKPPMKEIRKILVSQFHLIGSVKIAYFDFRHTYIDFSNEIDFNHVQFKEFVDIRDSTMKILKWTLEFKSEEEMLIVSI